MLKTTQDVATVVRQARKMLGLTQAQLAQRAEPSLDFNGDDAHLRNGVSGRAPEPQRD